MIHYICSVNNDDILENNFAKSINEKSLDDIQLIYNSEHLNSMAKKYNYAVNERKDCDDNDIFCFVHEDCELTDENFEEKIEMVYQMCPDVGVLGFIGTTLFTEDGGWWLCDRNVYTRGHLIQGQTDGTTYHMKEKGGIGFFDNLVSIDGYCFTVRKDVFNHIKFDENYTGYHFYDCDLCFETLIKTKYDVAVADILTTHKSVGELTDSWHKNRDKFLRKFKGLGVSYPVTSKSLKQLNLQDK